jgi:transcriptional regulator with XRE-family HTH domain
MVGIELQYEFDELCRQKSIPLIAKRKESNLSQRGISNKTGVSLKSIQRFESLESNNPYLIFAYQKLLK